MKILVTGKQVEVTPALEDHIREGLEKLTKIFDGNMDAEAVLSVEKRRHTAEINLRAEGYHLHSESNSDDMYKSIDICISRIQTQLYRHKEKMRTKRRKGSENAPGLGVKVDLLRGEDLEFGTEEPHIVRTRNYEVKPMSVDEAAMQMDLLHQDVLVFINDASNKLNVLYRRRDGNYDLIAPVL
ncbi:MAG: ribosome-associated translation inhibitor RaiA [Candidatus Omnitrophica bacterium]|nr:ribosome-associated translation inhibitor RaiA [Candidatus Omnitrophota bacterium]MCA9414619.1 ribosome-associated translation inhibitor RaiA [Candidatus Omnitrophota bacterium]MCA9423602.1 ribosome-associated translation inhibitor RaiA [Candidatus Omnitrophota bacterium]MCA9431157.1 ribosome-associated translation inhibitor RaiA [Candidatus Omnitrophota bacterium]MCA9434268.1 ribosome-associated translation inhibitor RaiA [Candidatus Omnitrophota bacterium]